MSSLDLMTHRCTIQRVTQTNVDGVVTPAWANIAANVKCLLQENSGKLQPGPAGQGLVYDAILFLPPKTEIRPSAKDDNNDRIIMTSPARVANIKYLVQIAVDESGQGDHLVAYLNRFPAP